MTAPFVEHASRNPLVILPDSPEGDGDLMRAGMQSIRYGTLWEREAERARLWSER